MLFGCVVLQLFIKGKYPFKNLPGRININLRLNMSETV